MTKLNCYICNEIIIDNETDPKNPIYRSYSETRIKQTPIITPTKPFDVVALCPIHEKAIDPHWKNPPHNTDAKVYKDAWIDPAHV